MTKKIIFLVAFVAMAVTTKLSAQEIKVTKQIKVYDWLNEAVVDGNQVEGGIHVYDNWVGVTAGLKTAFQKVGMLVTVIDSGDGTPGTYRLNTVGTAAVQNFTRIDAVLLADITARDELIDDIGATDAGLAIGTIVGVIADDAGEPAAFFYAGGTNWIALGGGSETAGFIAVGQQNSGVSYSSGYDADDSGTSMNSAGIGALNMADATKKLTTFEVFEFSLTNDGELPFICYPKAWNKPSFYISIDGVESPLTDCWTVTYSTQNAIEYQEWKADVNFTTGATSVLKLIVR
ncbi:hypothetical protein [Labilibaculum euxinus]